MTKLLSQIVHGLRDYCALEDEDGTQRNVESDQKPDEQLQRPTNPMVNRQFGDNAVGEIAELTFPHIPSFLYRCQVAFAKYLT